MLCFEVKGEPPESDVSQVLAIGKFDGVHLGHQAILDEARQFVTKSSRLAVMSFDPHPTYVLTGNETYLQSLTPPAEKRRILSEYGVDAFYEVQFDKNFSSIEPKAFVTSYLKRLSVTHVVVGEDFRFGRLGAGNAERLSVWASEVGMTVRVVSPVEASGVKMSSSQIRSRLSEGHVEAAQSLLGRPYTITGTVVHGDKRGRTIGFPTANLGHIEQYVLPKFGVYAVSVEVEADDTQPSTYFVGVLNLGKRPTVNGADVRMEVHLLGFDGDIYGRICRVSFLHRIRDEQKFDGLDALKTQIALDCDATNRLVPEPVTG